MKSPVHMGRLYQTLRYHANSGAKETLQLVLEEILSSYSVSTYHRSLVAKFDYQAESPGHKGQILLTVHSRIRLIV